MNVSPVFAKKRQSEAAPDHVSDPVSGDRTYGRRGDNDSDIDRFQTESDPIVVRTRNDVMGQKAKCSLKMSNAGL